MRYSTLHKIIFCLLMVFAGIASAQTTITSQIGQDNDDAEERVSNGSMDLGSSDLEIISEGGSDQLVGLRFQNINIPQGTTILSASIQFTTDETDSGNTSVTISGEDVNNASIFSNSDDNISDRTLTSASVAWNSIPAWNTVGQSGTNQETPDITSIVQEIINRGGWTSGNSMAFVINGSGERTAVAHDGDSSEAPVLTIVADFTPPPLTPFPVIVPNPNRGLPYIYFIADNRSELYSVAPDPTASPLPTPTTISTTYGGSAITFDGEGGGYRSTDRLVYVFMGADPTTSSDMYSIDPATGIATLVKSNIVPGHVDGAEFYINNSTGEEVMVLLYQNGTSGGANRIMALNPNANGSNPAWSPYAGYPIILNGARTTADGISWNPDTAEFYIQNDNNVDYYTVDITTGVTTFAFTTSATIDGEGITYASDGTNYIEDEDKVGQGRTIFIVDTFTGDLTPAAQLGSTGDVESIMGNLGTRNDAGDAPSSYGYAAHLLPVLTSTPLSIYLGAVYPDSEDPFVNFSTGFSDDNTGDDEDGVTSGGIDLSGQFLTVAQTKTIDVITNGSGVLNAWIDFNRDGDFDDSGEQIATDVTPSGGNITLSVSVPALATPGTSYARFRYSSELGLNPGNSEAADGEVEDYQVIIYNPTICPPGETLVVTTSISNVYATAVIDDDSVSNENNVLGNNDATLAKFNDEDDELVLEMDEIINNGDSTTVNGPDGDEFDIWVSASSTGPWTRVGNNILLDFTFVAPFDWLYIRFKSDEADNNDQYLSYIDASKTVAANSCELDNDGDGIADYIDLDDDNDGIPDSEECEVVDSGHDGSYPASDFSLSISSADPNNISGSHILDEITLKGQTFSDFIAPDSYSASYNNVNASGKVYLSDHTVKSFDYYNNPNFPDQIMPSFQSRDLNYYHAMDGSNYLADNYTLTYDSPITSTGDVTLIITERNGNNPYFVEALDAGGNVLGSISVNLSDYVDSGHKVNTYQSGGMFVALFPIDDIAPLGSKVRGLRMTFPGASSDGPDGKAFFFGDFSAASCDSDSDGIPNHFDLDSDNDGIYDAVEAGHDQAHTNGVVNSAYGANGLANNVETSPESGIINYTIADTDGDDLFDYIDIDSDADGCNDADEAYGAQGTDVDSNGMYGSGSPAVDASGRVSAATYPVPNDGNANSVFDYREYTIAPVINDQPVNRTICPTDDTTFFVTTSNANTFQWQLFNGSTWDNLSDGGIYSDTDTATLVITNASTIDDGNVYRVIVSNSAYICSELTSDEVTLTVAQPSVDAGLDQTICNGESATLTATPSGGSGSGYTYLWSTGSTTQSIVVNPTGNSSSNVDVDYTVTVTDSNSCFNNDIVRVTVEPTPTISVSNAPSCNFVLFQPTTYTVEVTVSSGTVTSTAGIVTNTSGNVWQIANVSDGTDIVATVTEGNCSADLPITAPNCACPAVNAPTSGGNQEYCAGSTIPTLTASVGGTETVDWFAAASGGTALASGTTSYTPPSAGIYYAEARSITFAGCTSASRTPITVTEESPSVVNIGPAQTVFVGQDATFTVATANADTYQWQVSSNSGSTYTDISDGLEYTGTQTTTLTVSSVEIEKNGFLYRVRGSLAGSSCNATISSAAILNIRVRTVITNRRITHRVKKN